MSKIITLRPWRGEHPSADLFYVSTNHISSFYRDSMGNNMEYTKVCMDDGTGFRVEEMPSEIHLMIL